MSIMPHKGAAEIFNFLIEPVYRDSTNYISVCRSDIAPGNQSWNIQIFMEYCYMKSFLDKSAS